MILDDVVGCFNPNCLTRHYGGRARVGEMLSEEPHLPRNGRGSRSDGPVMTRRHHDAALGFDQRHQADVAVRVTLCSGPVGPAEGAVVGDVVRLAPLFQVETFRVEPL